MSLMMANNFSTMMTYHSEAAVSLSFNGGGGSSSASQPYSSVVSSYNGQPSVPGGVESFSTTTASRFQPNLHGDLIDWTPEEQAILDEGLIRYAFESSLTLYAKIAMLLNNKTVRDVALRCKWMLERDYSKRRKDDLRLPIKGKETKENVTDPSTMSSNTMIQPAMDSITQELLRQNAQALKQISTNLSTSQIHNNIGLFCQACSNISLILKRINEPPYVIMNRMPPLPVKVNEELTNSILLQSTPAMQ